MNFKTPLCSHIDRFMVIVSKMTDGKYISLCYKISVFYFERVFHSFLISQTPEKYIIEYPPPPVSYSVTQSVTDNSSGSQRGAHAPQVDNSI